MVAKKIFGTTMSAMYGYSFFWVFAAITLALSFALTKLMGVGAFKDASKTLGNGVYTLLAGFDPARLPGVGLAQRLSSVVHTELRRLSPGSP